MITVEQIKAARGLLEWTQGDLAKAAKISTPAINNLERHLAQPRTSTLQRIEQAFYQAGVEFIEHGVRFRQEPLNIQVLEGDSAVMRWLHDVKLKLGDAGGESLISCVDERRFVDIAGDKLVKELTHMQSLNITDRVLIKEGDEYLIAPKECYRWVPDALFHQIPYTVYDNTYGIILWEPKLKIILIENPQIADSYRQQFWRTWALSKPIQ